MIECLVVGQNEKSLAIKVQPSHRIDVFGQLIERPQSRVAIFVGKLAKYPVGFVDDVVRKLGSI